MGNENPVVARVAPALCCPRNGALMHSLQTCLHAENSLARVTRSEKLVGNCIHCLKIEQMKTDPNIYQSLAESIAPAVFGHRDIKRAVLLMLLGGVHKVNPSARVKE